MASESENQTRVTNKRSFWPGIGFLIAAGGAKAIGVAISELAVGSARSSGSLLGSMNYLQMAANIEGTADVIMAVLGVIGIIQIIRTAMSRSRSKSTDS